tara:strand:+ start:2105 stop:3481 length:1377 start_codon:yes stop_codon:yes gene_type:complete
MTDATQLLFHSLTEVADLLAEGALSSVELTGALLDRIEATDDYYGAYVRVDRDGALAAAKEADTKRAKGYALGPLHGVPLAVKDIFGVKGLPTRCGSVMDEAFLPDEDAAAVAALRAAGAIILGKATTTEFALSGYHPDLRPPQNPWGHERWAGVSSSGSGVATAAGLAFGAVGTDTGGSVRYPAAANGVVGFKPTYGILNATGVFPLAPSLDHIGTFGRRVLDAALLFDVIHGTSNGPQYTRPSPLRIGTDVEFINAHAHPEVAAAVGDALKVLEAQGHVIVPVDFSPFTPLAELWGPVTAMEAAEVHKPYFPARAGLYGPVFHDLLEAGNQLTSELKDEINQNRAQATDSLMQLFDGVDALACPSAPQAAMPLAEFPPQAILPPETVAEFVTFTAPFNFAGTPTISAPCGFSSEDLPISLQLVGKRGEDHKIISAMYRFEQATDWHKRIPPAQPAE